MGCAAGYPTAPCPFGFEGTVTRANCGACKNFIPPKHILQWCSLYDRDKVICQLPKAACETCPFKADRRPGRPLEEGRVDWFDPESVARYKEDWRLKNAQKVKAAAERFASKHPDYFRNYYEENKEELKAKRKAKNERP